MMTPCPATGIGSAQMRRFHGGFVSAEISCDLVSKIINALVGMLFAEQKNVNDDNRDKEAYNKV